MTTKRRKDGKAALFTGSDVTGVPGSRPRLPTPRRPTPTPPGSGIRGRQALFGAEQRSGGPVTISCRACHAQTPVSWTDATRRLLRPGALWWPLASHAHRIRCPACGDVTWCRVDWSRPSDR